MSAFVTAGGGFLLAVLWFDLMFDVQTLDHREGDLPEQVLSSIAGYYGRVTTAARPMNRLIAAVMLATIAAVIDQIASSARPHWAALASIVLIGAPVLLAGTRTVPSAVRLGAREDSTAQQSKLARVILADHLFCAAAIAGLLVAQLSFL